MSVPPPQRPYLKCVTDSRKIHDNPCNVSPTKQLYSIPHSKRFDEKTAKSNCNQAFYHASDKLYKGHQGTALGLGNKHDFTKLSKNVPAPNAYLPKNLTITDSCRQKYGFSFGLSRDQVKQNGGVSYQLKVSASIPGPDCYAPKLPKSQIHTTLKSRIPEPDPNKCKIGPADYVLGPSFQTGKALFNSRHVNVKSVKFPPVKTGDALKEAEKNKKVFPKVLSDIAAGDDKYQMNAKGNYFNSKYKNTECLVFGKENRDFKNKKSCMPGPGDYVIPSEFGVYRSSKF